MSLALFALDSDAPPHTLGKKFISMSESVSTPTSVPKHRKLTVSEIFQRFDLLESEGLLNNTTLFLVNQLRELHADDIKSSDGAARCTSHTPQPEPLPDGLALYNHPEYGFAVTSSTITSMITSVLTTSESLDITPEKLTEWQDFRVHNATSVNLPAEFKLVEHPAWGRMIVSTASEQYVENICLAIVVDPRDTWKTVAAHIITVHTSSLIYI